MKKHFSIITITLLLFSCTDGNIEPEDFKGSVSVPCDRFLSDSYQAYDDTDLGLFFVNGEVDSCLTEKARQKYTDSLICNDLVMENTSLAGQSEVAIKASN